MCVNPVHVGIYEACSQQAYLSKFVTFIHPVIEKNTLAILEFFP